MFLEVCVLDILLHLYAICSKQKYLALALIIQTFRNLNCICSLMMGELSVWEQSLDGHATDVEDNISVTKHLMADEGNSSVSSLSLGGSVELVQTQIAPIKLAMQDFAFVPQSAPASDEEQISIDRTKIEASSLAHPDDDLSKQKEGYADGGICPYQ